MDDLIHFKQQQRMASLTNIIIDNSKYTQYYNTCDSTYKKWIAMWK